MKDNRGKTRKAFKAYCLLLAFLLALPGMGGGEDMGDLIAAEAGASAVITDSTGETSLKVDPAPAGELPDPSSDKEGKSELAGKMLSEEADAVPDSSPETGADLEPAGKMVPEEAEETPAEQLPDTLPEAEEQAPAEKMIPEEAEEASAEQVPDTSPETGEDLEPAGTMLPEDADEIPIEELPDTSSDTGENPEPAEEIPSGGKDDSPADQFPDIPTEPGKDPEPAEENPSGEKDDSPAEQLPGSSSDTGTIPGSTGKEVSGESEKTQEEAESRSGILYVDAVCEIQLQGSRTYLLMLPRRSDLVLMASGIPVKVTVASPQNGQKSYWESAAAEEQGVFVIHEALSLEKGEYSITVEPLRENQQGIVSICFSTPEPEVPVLTDAAAEDFPADETDITEEIQVDTILEEEAFDPESESVITETAEETVPAAETDENAEETGVMPENFVPGEEAEDVPEEELLQDPAENASDDEYAAVEGTEPDTDPDAVPVEPDGADSEETAAESLTVRIVASCEEGFQPGARIVLTAVVSDPDYEGTIRWQYSADGGMTICDVEDADDREYSFLLDEENIAYLWRACLE